MGRMLGCRHRLQSTRVCSRYSDKVSVGETDKKKYHCAQGMLEMAVCLPGVLSCSCSLSLGSYRLLPAGILYLEKGCQRHG